MAAIDLIHIGETINFEVYPSAILGTGFKNCKVLALLDADTAKLFNIDPVAMHISVYPTLPSELAVPNRYDGYLYAKLKLANGTITCIGVPWIKAETITAVVYTTARLEFANCTADDLQNLVEAAVANGYTPISADLV